MLATTQSAVNVVTDNGPTAQVFLPAAQLAGLVQTGGYSKLAVGATGSAAGSITVQRYIDTAGTIPQGPALTSALAGGAPGVLNVTDGVPFLSFTVTIAGGTLTNVGALLQAI